MFAEPPPIQLLCKICNRVYKDPTIMSCGHSYCKACSMSMELCPVDGKSMTAVSRMMVGSSTNPSFKNKHIRNLLE